MSANNNYGGKIQLSEVGLADLCEQLGLTLADAVAAGDSANDIGMLKAAGLSVCMANGTEDAKAAADRIVGDVREDGLADLIDELGGLHNFMNWHGPILTDSGGFQVFSHNDAVKLTDEGVRFIATDYDGSHVFWTPEDNMAIAQKLGSDICMQLDQCPGYPATRKYVERAVELSSMWAERCYKAHTRPDQALFGIVQGGMHLDLRLRSLKHLEECGDFPGYGIGGYSVGEDHETMFETLEPLVSEHMPRQKPRYLMGVGNPTTLVRAVGMGVDMFDCVLPTRTGRMGTAFSSQGRLNFRNAKFAHDAGPIDEKCTCPVCTGGYSRALIRHMVTQKEMLGGILLSQHNIYFLLDLMRRARQAIIDGRYAEFRDEWMQNAGAKDY